MKLYCKKCRYKFDKPMIPKRCPYCGKEGTIATVESAQNILDEVTQEIEMIERSRKERNI